MLHVALLLLGRSILSDNASGSASTFSVNSNVEVSIYMADRILMTIVSKDKHVSEQKAKKYHF